MDLVPGLHSHIRSNTFSAEGWRTLELRHPTVSLTSGSSTAQFPMLGLQVSPLGFSVGSILSSANSDAFHCFLCHQVPFSSCCYCFSLKSMFCGWTLFFTAWHQHPSSCHSSAGSLTLWARPGMEPAASLDTRRVFCLWAVMGTPPRLVSFTTRKSLTYFHSLLAVSKDRGQVPPPCEWAWTCDSLGSQAENTGWMWAGRKETFPWIG